MLAIKRCALVCMVALMAGCGGGAGSTTELDGGGDFAFTPVVQGDGMALGVLKDASGVPSGVRVSWTRVDVTGVQGYYIYRAENADDLPDGDPADYSTFRIPDGDGDDDDLIEQFGSGTQVLTFDNLFSPTVGDTYYYRMTVVNSTADESDFSAQLSITIAAHTITAITTTPVGIGDEVTIDGTYFGQTQNGDKVYFTDAGGTTDVEAASYVSWGPTQIVVTVPYGAADGEIGVMIGTSTVLSADSIAYMEPDISGINPGEDWVAHDYITITGTDFGPAPGSGGTDSNVYFGGTVAQSSDYQSWSDTQIEVKVPAAAVGATVDVQVEVADNMSDTISFIILPHIDSFTPTSGVTGTSVTLSGTNFGSAQGTVMVAGVSASVTSWNNTTAVITIPDAAVDGDVVLTRTDTKTSNGGGFDVVPTLTGFSPTRRVVGESLTINGSGFGNTRGSSTVHFDGGSGVDVATYTTWTSTQLVVVVPAGAETGTVTVTISDADVGSNQDSVTTATNVAIVLPAPDMTGVGQL